MTEQRESDGWTGDLRQHFWSGSAVLGSIAAQTVAAAHEGATVTEVVALQVLGSVLAVWAAYRIGKVSAAATAREMMRPHARSAFRRAWSLYAALSRFTATIAERREILERAATMNDGQIASDRVMDSLGILEAQIVEQIGTASDALEDWRDIVPEDVAEIERRAKEASRGG